MPVRGAPKVRRLYLLRHADAESASPAGDDAARGLSRLGRAQARFVAEALAGVGIELVLSSTAVRARQTTELVGLGAPVRYLPRLYGARARHLLAELAGIDDSVRTVLMVGHAPGLPTLAYQLADQRSDPTELARIRPMFPPATLVGLEFFGGWSELDQARLFVSVIATAPH